MNAALLLMSSAALAGADVAPPAAAAPAPVVIHGGAGCTNCSVPAPAPCGCEKKPGLFDKLKSRCSGFGKKSSSDCGCVPACAPVPPPPPAACNTCNTCSTGKADRPNLFDKLKARCGHKKADSCGPVCDPCGAAHLTGGCATPGVPYTPPATGGTTPPKEMPKEIPKDPVKPKGNTVVPLPLPPVSGASGLSGSTSPY